MIPRATEMNLSLSICSSVKIAAIAIVNIGFRHIIEAAVDALQFSIPIWKRSMLTGMPIQPTRKSQVRSRA